MLGNVAFLRALRRRHKLEVRMCIMSNVAFALGLRRVVAHLFSFSSSFFVLSSFSLRARRVCELVVSTARHSAGVVVPSRARAVLGPDSVALLAGITDRSAWRGDEALELDAEARDITIHGMIWHGMT